MGLLSPGRKDGEEPPRRPNGEPIDQVDRRRDERTIEGVDWRLVRSAKRSRDYEERMRFADLNRERLTQNRILDERLVAMGPRPEGGWKVSPDSPWAS